ncbi:MAG: ABC transporter permease [Aeromicrobium sp.]|uniref:ABC transporter permease n=1 Tax=Aeromicrobium sp. TaxID=1871063 RepID=UPI0025BB1418|nr:ABC transporter permease [Aeromicrobium sp.]MCK5892427.1 ABC transporter permease [Aeromicrobium sp.]MDF1704068.1 ABC transporter permease [Aeromicrobium sp.]
MTTERVGHPRVTSRALTRASDAATDRVATVGTFATFVVRAVTAVPTTLRHYRAETFRILLDISWGTGAILVGGGTVGVMVLLALSAGTSLGIEGFNGLETIGLAPLTGFVSAVVNTRELAPLVAALALAAQVGCRFTAQLGSMRTSEEIDALGVMAVPAIPYLVTTRIIATMMAILPLYMIGLAGSYLASQMAVTVLFGQPSGTYEHYFGTFIAVSDVLLSVVKIVVFAFAVAVIHCWYGFMARGGAEGVGEATGRAIRASIVVVVLLNMVMTLLFWGGDPGVRISG